MGTFLLLTLSRSCPRASHAQPQMASLSATHSSHPWSKPTVLLIKQASPCPRQANQACIVLATGKVEVKRGMLNQTSLSLMIEPGISVPLPVGKVHGDHACHGSGFYLITLSM